jgi:hypothetical protein
MIIYKAQKNKNELRSKAYRWFTGILGRETYIEEKQAILIRCP